MAQRGIRIELKFEFNVHFAGAQLESLRKFFGRTVRDFIVCCKHSPWSVLTISVLIIWSVLFIIGVGWWMRRAVSEASVRSRLAGRRDTPHGGHDR